MEKTAITPTRLENYPQWYQQVITASELAENSEVRGCMVIKPWGYAIWENIQSDLDRRFKDTGHVNAYFPLLIPLSHLEREADHVDGFAKECAVVTHTRLISDGDGGLKPDGKLEEPLIIRPTSETIIGATYAKWVNSYRDLPILINQWANVMRWEMRTRLFLRTSEFLWQEGHTVHSTKEEAMAETLLMLDVYAKFAQEVLAIPVICGEKTCFERFPGAVNTYCIEAMMQDKKALQAGTSHFLGQNFAKASGIQFTNKEGVLEYAWTTSWGVSTRLIGGLIMAHSDDDGLVLPPRIAPKHIVIIPLIKLDDVGNSIEDNDIVKFCRSLEKQLKAINYHQNTLKVHVDTRDINGGAKSWEWVKKGVPIRLEVGARDMANGTLTVGQRNLPKKQVINMTPNDFIARVVDMLDQIQNGLFEKALKYRQNNTFEINSLEDFNKFFKEEQNISPGFVKCYAIDDKIIEGFLKPLQVTARCILINEETSLGKCIFTGKPALNKMIFAKAY